MAAETSAPMEAPAPRSAVPDLEAAEQQRQRVDTMSAPSDATSSEDSNPSGGGRRVLGSGCMVAAAFIGPGTVTSCSIAGAKFGTELLWTITFSVVSAFILQEMSSRLGLVCAQGLPQAFKDLEVHPAVRRAILSLVCLGVGVVCALFESGNIAGAALGLSFLTRHHLSVSLCAILVGLLVMAALASGSIKVVQNLMAAVVAVMSVVFLICAIISRPSVPDVLISLFVPRIPEGSLTTVLALIGTTIVCYNLFLQASVVASGVDAARLDGQKMNEESIRQQLRWLRVDTACSILMGGIISSSIVITAASAFDRSEDKGDPSLIKMAAKLEPLLGSFASTIFSLGMLCAGLSSAITAPLAAQLAVSDVFGWQGDQHRTKSASLWIAVCLLGTALAAMPFLKSIALIMFAQVMNALVLPLFAGLIVFVTSKRAFLGEFSNGRLAIAAGCACCCITLGLSVFNLYRVIA